MDIICVNCQNRVMVPPNTACCRCPFCKILITAEQVETSPGVYSHKLWKPRCPDNRCQLTTKLPPTVQKPKPTSFPAAHQPKRAVLCGVRYGTKKLKLREQLMM
ncbi:hypothetical protein NMG60_11021434 [Bertholletia excelsa]